MTIEDKDKEEEIFKDIWDNLSQIDVSDFTEDRGGLSYLSWASAWTVLMNNYPGAQFRFIGSEVASDCHFYPDETTSVECIISIRGVHRSMWLPVMDFRHNAIKNPSSRQISDSKMRCLTKCMALFGLGMHVFRGEDLPPQEEKPAPKKKSPKKKDAKKSGEHAVVIATRALLVEAVEGGKELVDVWSANAEAMKKLKEENPEAYADVVELFKTKRDELAEGNGNGKSSS